MEIRTFTLAHPFRVVIDMPQVTFNLPLGAGDSGRGLIKAYRFGLVMQGGSRMVIDLARPARVDKAFVIDAANDQPARLVIDLASTSGVSQATRLETHAPNENPPTKSFLPGCFFFTHSIAAVTSSCSPSPAS